MIRRWWHRYRHACRPLSWQERAGTFALLLLVTLAGCTSTEPTPRTWAELYGCLDPAEWYGCATPVPTMSPPRVP